MTDFIGQTFPEDWLWSRYENQYIGRSIYNQSVFTKNKSNLINKVRDVEISDFTDFSLEGSI